MAGLGKDQCQFGVGSGAVAGTSHLHAPSSVEGLPQSWDDLRRPIDYATA